MAPKTHAHHGGGHAPAHHNQPQHHGGKAATSGGGGAYAKEMGSDMATAQLQIGLESLLDRYPAEEPYYVLNSKGRIMEDDDGDKIKVSGEDSGGARI
jgi:hypothetical protein